MIHDSPKENIFTFVSVVVSTPIALDSIGYLQTPILRYFPSLSKKVNGKAWARNDCLNHPGDDKTPHQLGRMRTLAKM